MFKPKYTITNNLLVNIKQITNLVNELNKKQLPDIVLVELERTARAVSTFASTSIEGNPLPLTEVERILKSRPSQIRQSEQEVLNYNQALQDLNNKLEQGLIEISVSLVLSIHKQITNILLPIFQSGKFRKEPVQVSDPATGRIIYLPPEYKDVSNLVEELIAFIQSNKDQIDPLILAGIFHKQMVLIHPFMDGNGRATRLTTKVLLAHMGLNTFNLFSFENYYNRNVKRYFENVGEQGNYYDLMDHIDFTVWLEYFTEGIIDELLRIQKILPGCFASPQDELKDYHLKILDFIRHKGFIADRDYARLVDRAKATRNLDFNKLIDMGIISKHSKGKSTYYTLEQKGLDLYQAEQNE